MITVIDKIQYLPKDRNSILDVNELTNQAHRLMVDEIKKATRKINSQGKTATVTVTGRVKKGVSKNDFNVSVVCEDDDLRHAIEKTLEN